MSFRRAYGLIAAAILGFNGAACQQSPEAVSEAALKVYSEVASSLNVGSSCSERAAKALDALRRHREVAGEITAATAKLSDEQRSAVRLSLDLQVKSLQRQHVAPFAKDCPAQGRRVQAALGSFLSQLH